MKKLTLYSIASLIYVSAFATPFSKNDTGQNVLLKLLGVSECRVRTNELTAEMFANFSDSAYWYFKGRADMAKEFYIDAEDALYQVSINPPPTPPNSK